MSTTTITFLRNAIVIKYEIMKTNKREENSLTPWAHIIWRWWRVLSRGRWSLTAPRSRVTASLPMLICVWLQLVASEEEGLWSRRGIASHIR